MSEALLFPVLYVFVELHNSMYLKLGPKLVSTS